MPIQIHHHCGLDWVKPENYRNFDLYGDAFRFALAQAKATGVAHRIMPWESHLDGSKGYDVHAHTVHSRRGHGHMVVFPDGVATDSYYGYVKEFKRNRQSVSA